MPKTFTLQGSSSSLCLGLLKNKIDTEINVLDFNSSFNIQTSNAWVAFKELISGLSFRVFKQSQNKVESIKMFYFNKSKSVTFLIMGLKGCRI